MVCKILLIILCVAAMACNSVKDIVNNAFPGKSYKDEQLISLKTNGGNLKQIDSADITVNLGKDDLELLLDSAISDLTEKNLKKKHISECRLSRVRTSLDDQLILLSLHFDLKLDTMNVSMEGDLKGAVSFMVRDDSLKLYPAFKSLHLDDLSYKKLNKTEEKVFSGFLNGVLSLFLDNINAYLNSKLLAIDLNLLRDKISDPDITPYNDVTVHFSDTVFLSIPSFSTSVLTDKKGIHVLAVRKIVPGSLPATLESFSKDYAQFRDDYYEKLKNNFAGTPDADKTYFLISKKTFSSIINNALGPITATASYREDTSMSTTKNIHIASTDIDCNNVEVKCPALHVLPSCNPPDFGNCDHHCGGGILGKACRLGELPCKAAAAAAHLTWYNTVYIPCMQARAAEIATNAGIQAACIAGKEALRTSCLVTKTAIHTVGGNIPIGIIDLNVEVNIGATATISGFNLSSDLSTTDFSMVCSALVPTSFSFKLSPQGAGHLVCALNVSHTIPLVANASITIPHSKVQTIIDKSDDGKILLKIQINPVNLEASISPAPLGILDGSLPAMLDCPFFASLVSGADALLHVKKGFNDLFLRSDYNSVLEKIIYDGKYDYTTKAFPFNIPVKSHPVKLINKEIVITPLISNSYFGFSD